MARILSVFDQLKPVSILAIGDIVLDHYIEGDVKRISPEAPVPVLHAKGERSCPGMLGNVVLNLLALSAEVTVVSRVGEDSDGMTLIESLQDHGADTSGIFFEKQYQTPKKTRLVASSQQLLRIDQETISPISQDFEKKVIDFLREKIDSYAVIAISDYGKGFLSDNLLQEVLLLARKKGIPTIVDPKGLDFSKYQFATLIKPNEKEAYEAAKCSLDTPIKQVGFSLLESTQAEKFLITRSSKGISLFFKKKQKDFPVLVKQVVDVTGAGDTVLAILTVCLGNKIAIEQSIHLANIAASMVIERLGCSKVTLGELATKCIHDHIDHKVFDETSYAVKQMLKTSPYQVLKIGKTDVISPELFLAITGFGSKEKLVVYLEAEEVEDAFISMLSSFKEVDFIFLEESVYMDLIKTCKPKKIFSVHSLVESQKQI